MISISAGSRTEDSVQEPLKRHIQNSREVLVDALYNIEPLLDCMIAANLLTQDNFFDVRAEKNPRNKARKLLEVVQHQMDEEKVYDFLECLKKCKKQYPRLKDWLATDVDLNQGPTEQKLRAQISEICQRLGHNVDPISIKLFSEETLSHFELEQVQGSSTLFTKAQVIISACLAKGEKACKSFYQALHEVDKMLAEDLEGGKLSNAAVDFSLTSKQEWEASSDLNFSQSVEMPGMSIPTAVQESQQITEAEVQRLTLRIENGENVELDQWESELIANILSQLKLQVGPEAKLNACELGLALGLSRAVVRECILELESIGDLMQLAAIVHCFWEKTQDQTRLLQKVAACNTKRLMLSERGKHLLLLLQMIMADTERGMNNEPQWQRVFHFILLDCFVEAEECCFQVDRTDPLAIFKCMKENIVVDHPLIQELACSWNEKTIESYQQRVRLLAQLVRDLFPLLDCVQFDGVLLGEVHRCKPRQLHRVTNFIGLPPRKIRKVFNEKMVPSKGKFVMNPVDWTVQYGDICVLAANLLYSVCPGETGAQITATNLSDLMQEIQVLLSKPAFDSQCFDAGVKLQLLSLLDFGPTVLAVPTLINLHWNTLCRLAEYLKTSERHIFQFAIEEVWLQDCSDSFQGVCSIRNPVTIDNGVEEVFEFSTTKSSSFIVKLHCRGYQDDKLFTCRRPAAFRIRGLPETAVVELKALGGRVLLAKGGLVWLRDESQGGLKEQLQSLSQSHGAQVTEAGCCFFIQSSDANCEIRFIYKNGSIAAMAQKNAQVL
ncbi:uncharacterized protein LOC114650671 isoform X1 [Erpetoichthys calabaricus]|uniref:uncharacterized protein LOC114650671 isoform X1 n=1 Tax=Erpetoichthys calabaricus TaxID=27687 RepID=UPI0010A0AC19|nr:uncharacterized protein LOC114650671 isoform X1 [Erpetoichthys calabaricus]